MRKTIISLLVVICCLTSHSHVVAQDFITEISTPNQLAELALQVNEGRDYSGQTVTLTADIDLSNFPNWTPIGIYAYNHFFNGTFNGQNHQITNLQVDAKATETGFVAGLFGVVGSAGTIKDLTVVTTEVRIDKTEIVDEETVVVGEDYACFVGSIAGQNFGSIVGCANRGVSVYGNWQGARVGGIAGDNSGNISNCYNLGLVYTSSPNDNLLGGIVGQNNADGTVKNCFVRASVDPDGNAHTKGPICGNNLGNISGCFYMNGSSVDVDVSLVLNNNTPNNFSDAYGQTKNVLLNDRILYSDAAWNTLCLPFDIPAGAEGYSPIAGADVRELQSASFDSSSGVLKLHFSDVASIEAGKPYIMRWKNAIAEDLHNPVFLSATISEAPPTPVTYTLDDDNNTITFVGSFSPVSTDVDNTILYLGAGNGLYYPNASMTIGSFRAIFRLSGIEAGDPAVGNIKAFTVDYGDDDVENAITSVFSPKVGEQWYTLKGQKLTGKPSVPGIYIHNGKKIVLK